MYIYTHTHTHTIHTHMYSICIHTHTHTGLQLECVRVQCKNVKSQGRMGYHVTGSTHQFLLS